jgi:hypothetical protein
MVIKIFPLKCVDLLWNDPYVSTAWNTLTSTDSSKVEHIQWKFLAFCDNNLFSEIHYSYDSALDYFHFHTLYVY